MIRRVHLKEMMVNSPHYLLERSDSFQFLWKLQKKNSQEEEEEEEEDSDIYT